MREYTKQEYHQLFDSLFPNGMASADIIAELAPMGWDNSPLNFRHHPTLEEAYQNSVQHHEFMQRIMGKVDPDYAKDHPSFEAFSATFELEKPTPEIELQELIGACVWDIFSDNNDVVRDGKVYHIGSFRGAATFIADRLNTISVKEYDYMNFYMGSSNFTEENDCDVTPIYTWIFQRLKSLGCDWHFNFTQINLVDMGAQKPKEDTPIDAYDPNKALEQELKDAEERTQKEAFKAKIEDMNAKEREDALYKPPPAVVQAYKGVYGKFPLGWPPI
jgi:hypothetical protein